MVMSKNKKLSLNKDKGQAKISSFFTKSANVVKATKPSNTAESNSKSCDITEEIISDVEIIDPTPAKSENFPSSSVIATKSINLDDSFSIVHCTPQLENSKKKSSFFSKSADFNKKTAVNAQGLNALNNKKRSEILSGKEKSSCKRSIVHMPGLSPNAKKSNADSVSENKLAVVKKIACNIVNKLERTVSEINFSDIENKELSNIAKEPQEILGSKTTPFIDQINTEDESETIRTNNMNCNLQNVLCFPSSQPFETGVIESCEETGTIKNQHSKPNCSDVADVFEDSLSLDFNHLSPFKSEAKYNLESQTKLARIERELDKLKVGKDSFVSKGDYGRYLVICVTRDCYNRQLVLELTCLFQNSRKKCFLTGFWFETIVKEFDIIHIMNGEERNNEIFITNEKGLLVTKPDYLISGTSVVSGVFCRRKAILNERFKMPEADAIDSSRVMIIGTIVHQLFQEGVKKYVDSEKMLSEAVDRIISLPGILKSLYGLNLDASKIIGDVQQFLPHIKNWSRQYLQIAGKRVSAPHTSKKDNWKGSITKIADIEENVWSPQFGIKGKIDLTVEATKDNVKKILPLELKTGRATFSAEHQGQVTLYTMIAADRRPETSSGLLLYLRESLMREVVTGNREKRDLVQLRNELIHHLTDSMHDNELPSLAPPLDNIRSCGSCSQLLSCCAWQKVAQKHVLHDTHAMHDLCNKTLSHLSQPDLDYFGKWCTMLLLEASDYVNDPCVRALWCIDAKQREEMGNCITNLQLHRQLPSLQRENGVFVHHLIAVGERNMDTMGFQIGESVIVSGDEMAISRGVILEFKPNLSLALDRDLYLSPKWKDQLFCIDRCAYQNTMSINFSNVARLISDNDRAKKLRSIIIQCKTPEFSEGLSRDVIVKGKSVLKYLNKDQQKAILKCVMAKDYVVLKGYPGTGKTSTIVALARVLSALGHSILVTSYTHSAVDNILLKLKEFGTDFLRLGQTSRIHKDILDYSEERITQKFKTIDQLKEFYDSKNIVATTCLGANQVLFSRKKFDFCIIDEASQVLEVASIGVLFHCNIFILVGDSLQLPPIVHNKQAKSLGMAQSLFEWLDNRGATVSLTLQYRMNAAIMRIANELVYEGALQCATPDLQSKTIDVKEQLPSHSNPPWLQRVFSPNLSDAVLFIDTAGMVMESRDKGGLHVMNEGEGEMVVQVVQAFVMQHCIPMREIGVITPFRAQVKLIKGMLEQQLHCLTTVEVNTVDQYQGRDKQVILYSCVRSNPDLNEVSSDEILSDLRRLNVALTRAKYKLVIIGDTNTLQHYQPFKALIGCLHKEQIVSVKLI